MPRRTALTVASVNVNGIRAATRNGIAGWIADRKPDVVTLQEVRAADDIFVDHVDQLWGSGWNRVHGESEAKGRAGVAVVSRHEIGDSQVDIGGTASRFNRAGRWVEATIDVPGFDQPLTVVSVYVHTGDADSPERMEEKLAFMSAMTDRMEALRATGNHVLVTGDLNVGHTELDIKNWKGNRNKAGFLEVERAWFDRWFGDLDWIDVARSLAGDVEGPYTWWSFRGQAFDKDVGWRIDYQIATPELAERAAACHVDRAPSYAERWSDHAPLVVEYRI
ncbi:exodeoxyribonuclease III [Ilumatobacteraceae bacterium]|nr:exodeoxyribonuclease III [Ilumatobacteraceae bacterium]